MKILLAISLWTIISVLYVFHQLGVKHTNYKGFRKLVDIVLGTPALVITMIISLLSK